MIGVVVLILVALLYFSDIEDIIDIIQNADWPVLGFDALFMFAGMFMITTRWRFILNYRTEFFPTLIADAISYTIKLFLPIPIPVLWVANLSLITSINPTETTPAAVINQTIGFIMRMIALALTLFFISGTEPSVWVAISGILLLFGLLFLLSWLVKNINKILPRLSRVLLSIPNMTEERLQGGLENVQSGLSEVQSTRKLAIALLMSLVLWTFFLLFYTLGFPALRLDVSTREALTMASAALVIIPPSTPPMIGVFQGIMVAVLLPFGVLNLTEATAYAIIIFLVMLVLWLVLAIWGLRAAHLRVSDVIHDTNQVAPDDPGPNNPST